MNVVNMVRAAPVGVALLLCMAGAVLFIFIALIVPMMRMSSGLST